MEKLYHDSLQLLHSLSTPSGLMASEIESDNYKRVWGRDSVVCGIAGLLAKDAKVIGALKQSLLTLAKHQNELGMIPSNVLDTDKENDVSFGSLVGRVDSNTWFVIGSCLYYQNTRDQESWPELKKSVKKCLEFLESIQFNHKGWIYTPLSGNWADEYPIHGYTLYDNCLYLWALKLWNSVSESTNDFSKISAKIKVNFWPSKTTDESLVYQKGPFEKSANSNLNHFCAFILPGIYDDRFDAAGNALAMLQMELSQNQKLQIKDFLQDLHSELNTSLIPAFWPPIRPKSKDWYLLEGNYSFNFKNHPHFFHNGGIWPVWMGLFCLALAKQGLEVEAEKIIASFLKQMEALDFNFEEYIDSKSFDLQGKERMGYTASGIVFMYQALHFEGVCDTLGL